MIDPERLGLQSASSAHRRRRCTGSVGLVNLLKANGKLLGQSEPDPDAASGSLVHAAWCGDPLARTRLDGMQTETLRSLERLEQMVVAEWAGKDQYALLGREARLWLHEGLEPIHSGQFDVAYGTICTKRMLILDGKTLFDEVSPAETNDQLRELMALARFNYPGCVEFTLGILQPWVTRRPILAVFDAAEAELALRLLRHTIAESADPEAPRTPGAWCKHCPALGQCEEARVRTLSTFDLAGAIKSGDCLLPLGERGSELLDRFMEAEALMKAARSRYKEILESEPEALPGWTLKAGVRTRAITDVFDAWELVKGAMSLPDFLSAAELKIGALETQLGKERFSQLFAPVIQIHEQAQKLAKTTRRTARPELEARSRSSKPSPESKPSLL